MPSIRRDLTIPEAFDFGCQLASAGNHESACGIFRGILKHEPHDFNAIERLGACLFERKQFHEALYWFWRGMKINRREPMALTNYGLCLAQLGHEDESLSYLQLAVHQGKKQDISPHGMALFYNNLGNTLERIRRYPEALEALDAGLKYNPTDSFALYNRGIVLLRLNRQREAITSFDAALVHEPGNADCHYNRGMGRLLLGDLTGGLADYEYRLVTTENEKPNFGLPANKRWDGSAALKGKTLLIHGEQGLGDDIQFFRFLDQVLALEPNEVKIVIHSATRLLIEHLPVTVLPPGSDLGDYDHWVALMSLAKCFGVKTERDIPSPFAIRRDGEREASWAERFDVSADALRVGVCWAGNWLHKNDRHRSIPLAQFAQLFSVQGCTFVSLQQVRPDETAEFIRLRADNPGIRHGDLNDLRDTAAIIRNLDMVITVDTAVAHLAATLGKPTWILIPKFATDWRWQLARTDSPWYPSAVLYRQETIGDWSMTLRKLRSDLTANAVSSAREAA